MGRGRPKALENAVIGLFVALAAVLGYLGLRRAFMSGPSKRASVPEFSQATRPGASGDWSGSETESAVSALPAVKLSSARGRRARRRSLPPPAPQP